MVRHWLIALGLALLTATAWGRPHLSLAVDKHDIALGEALTVTIRAADTGAALDSLDLNALKTILISIPAPPTSRPRSSRASLSPPKRQRSSSIRCTAAACNYPLSSWPAPAAGQ
jgi:hypothetical protein